MAWMDAFPGALSGAYGDDRTERAWRWPVGAVSPLWAVFGAAASAGVAWWWLTHWTRVTNVEALAEFAAVRVKQEVESAADAGLRLQEAVAAADAASRGPEPPATPTLVEAVQAADGAAADDLTRMTGVGPKLSMALAERGVTRFAQIAAWTDDDLAEVDAALKLKGRAVREAWVAQARRLAKS